MAADNTRNLTNRQLVRAMRGNDRPGNQQTAEAARHEYERRVRNDTSY